MKNLLTTTLVLILSTLFTFGQSPSIRQIEFTTINDSTRTCNSERYSNNTFQNGSYTIRYNGLDKVITGLLLSEMSDTLRPLRISDQLPYSRVILNRQTISGISSNKRTVFFEYSSINDNGPNRNINITPSYSNSM